MLNQPTTVFLFIAVFSLTILRLVLSFKAPYFVNMYAGYDDQLFVQYSKSILSGNWLGAYSTRALSKGVSYALFMVWSNKLHFSYGFFLGLFNVLASSVAALALKPLIKNRWILVFIYTFFLFSPVGLTSEYSTRIYRNPLVIPTVFLVIGCLVGLYFRKNARIKIFACWSIGLACSFPFFWYIREDSLWLFPLVFFGLVIIAGSVLFDTIKPFKMKEWQIVFKSLVFTKQKAIKLVLCLLPFILLFTTTKVLQSLNTQHYGVSLVNDRTGGAFKDVSKQLIRMDDGTSLNQTNATIWVSKEALKKAEKVSPTLKSISKNIDWIYNGSPWTGGEEIAGDIIFWALRDAAAQAGYYKNAKQTEAFWQKVNTELSDAYANGKLEKKKEIYLSATGDGKTLKDLPLVGEFMRTGLAYNLLYKDYSQGSDQSLGLKKDITEAEKILGHSFDNNWRDVNEKNKAPIKITLIAKISNIIIRLYQKLLPIWLIINVLGLGIILAGSFFSKSQLITFRGLLLLIVGLMLTYLVFLIGVSWFCSWAPDRKELFMMTYTGAGVPVIQWIEVLTLIGLLQLPIIAKKIKK
ncbi:hypothetical protein RV04_GL002398 [Enterococcus hermanniensis]|uniref:Glucosyltransferase n=2 Tax=Enterococcus hermanniensis TaxID=249189 RepID=A0A1L8TLW8_9ENTE|nr:hypothetical protein RV04_GL002398 [Enterococcus hermanniensis]